MSEFANVLEPDPSATFFGFETIDGRIIQMKQISGPPIAGVSDAVITQAAHVAAPAALTSSQNATAAAVDLPTTEALANALKTSYNQLQADVAALQATVTAEMAALQGAGKAQA